MLLNLGRPPMILSDRVRRLAIPIAAFLFGLAMLGLALVLTFAPSGPTATAAVGGPIALVDQDGRTVTEASFAGRPHLVFFGFTHCPDVCPTTLFRISEVLKAAGDRGRDLRAVFITVDPERDTPAALKDYLSSFDPRITAPDRRPSGRGRGRQGLPGLRPRCRRRTATTRWSTPRSST